MTTQRPSGKFRMQQQKIAELEKSNPRFRRIYQEYELLEDELWALQTVAEPAPSDDLLNAMKLQADCLEGEIDDWLTPPQGAAPQTGTF